MIALYKGRSLISRAIRCFTWSPYSHAAWIDTTANCVIEAWSGRVRRVADMSNQHTPGTAVDIFYVDVTREQDSKIAAFMQAQVGKRYDYRGVIHFITRRSENASGQTRWFCSELVHAAYRSAGIELLSRIPDYKVSPGLLSYSPLLRLVSTIKTRATEKASNRLSEQGAPKPAPSHAQTANPPLAERATGLAETLEDWQA
jgi:hypothetical protein